MQKSSHAAVDWFPISTAECIGLMLNRKTTLIRPEPLVWFPKYMMIRYAPLQTWTVSQPPQANSLAVKNRIANEIEGYIFTSLTRMTARLICVLAAIFNLRFLSH